MKRIAAVFAMGTMTLVAPNVADAGGPGNGLAAICRGEGGELMSLAVASTGEPWAYACWRLSSGQEEPPPPPRAWEKVCERALGGRSAAGGPLLYCLVG